MGNSQGQLEWKGNSNRDLENEYKEHLKRFYETACHDNDVDHILAMESSTVFRFMTPTNFEQKIAKMKAALDKDAKKKGKNK